MLGSCNRHVDLFSLGLSIQVIEEQDKEMSSKSEAGHGVKGACF